MGNLYQFAFDMNNLESLPMLYRELADWWPVLSLPEDYAEEAEFYRKAIVSSSASSPHILLELGSGGGNNASHLKKHFQMTLVDISPGMLEVSRGLNPECEHIQGDMRTVRLGRMFDAVFIHDAIGYMTSEADLRSALKTAFEHCKPGGIALFTPDHTKENFKSGIKHGGHDLGNRSMRYLEWIWDPDSRDTSYLSLMVYVLREGVESVRCVQDKHILGLFPHKEWLRLISEVGFKGQSIFFVHSEIEPDSCEVFIGLRPY
jgi:SAM-dependent methyltransferase